VVPIAVKAAFLNCGQNCASGERFIVHTKVYDAFVEAVRETAAAMRQGPTLGQGEDNALPHIIDTTAATPWNLFPDIS
jgi:acyl-CoA reductase-like NAD-dependent aldehyde dehydrogenase